MVLNEISSKLKWQMGSDFYVCFCYYKKHIYISQIFVIFKSLILVLEIINV